VPSAKVVAPVSFAAGERGGFFCYLKPFPPSHNANSLFTSLTKPLIYFIRDSAFPAPASFNRPPQNKQPIKANAFFSYGLKKNFIIFLTQLRKRLQYTEVDFSFLLFLKAAASISLPPPSSGSAAAFFQITQLPTLLVILKKPLALSKKTLPCLPRRLSHAGSTAQGFDIL